MVPRLLLICAVFVVLFLSACTQAGGVDGWVKPIYISKDDILTEGTAKQILTHNTTIDKLTK